MKTLAVIPARIASTRLPRKMLRDVAGKPLVVRVYDAVKTCAAIDDIVIATDSDEIMSVCRLHQCNVRMTMSSHRSGTERVHEISAQLTADVYLNVQGDEPLTRADQIQTLVELMQNSAIEVGTLKTKARHTDIHNPAAVKVVTDIFERALYFSRAAVPHDRDSSGASYFKHLGFYAYRKAALDRFVSLPESSLERSEKLEQLRFLENGMPIYVKETPFDSIGVDTEDDLQRVEEILRTRT